MMRHTTFLLLISIFSLSTLFAQQKEARTYPATQSVEGEKMRTFAAQFEETNVGNLHLYAKSESMSEMDYYFKGKDLPNDYLSLFDTEWQDFLRNYRVNATAVYQIKGDGRAYFIIRTKGPITGERLELFEVADSGNQLEHKLTLAFADCYRSSCYQQDSWLIDLDGDTRLDLIKKMRVINQTTGKISEQYATMLKQGQDGVFGTSSSLKANLNDYLFEDLGGDYMIKE